MLLSSPEGMQINSTMISYCSNHRDAISSILHQISLMRTEHNVISSADVNQAQIFSLNTVKSGHNSVRSCSDFNTVTCDSLNQACSCCLYTIECNVSKDTLIKSKQNKQKLHEQFVHRYTRLLSNQLNSHLPGS